MLGVCAQHGAAPTWLGPRMVFTDRHNVATGLAHRAQPQPQPRPPLGDGRPGLRSRPPAGQPPRTPPSCRASRRSQP